MKLAACRLFFANLPSNVHLAALSAKTAEYLEVGSAAALMAVGVWLRWQATDYQMSVEDLAKDGRLSEEQARRRTLLFDWSGPACVILGAALLGYALIR
jgi:ABC-type nickel/cobalt efflux system permease component RcnA